MARVPLPASKLRARKRRRRMVWVLVTVLALCALVGGAVALSWAPFLAIQHIELDGVSSANTAAVTDSVHQTLSGSYWHLFAKKNIFLYSKSAIRSSLIKQFPVFASVSVSARDFNTVVITVEERASHALWCGEGPELSSACLSLDNSGAAYTLAADFSGDVYTRYVGPLPAGALPRQFLTPERFQALNALVDELTSRVASTSVHAVVVGNDEVHMEFDDGFTILFELEGDGADILERFALARDAEPFTTHPLSDFEYLDLRFGDKLYYKLKDTGQ